jgi:hypothetical protein
MEDVVRLRYLLELASVQLKRLEEESPTMVEEVDDLLRKSLGVVHKTYFAGPQPYNPGSTFEKCDNCGRYRLRKK